MLLYFLLKKYIKLVISGRECFERVVVSWPHSFSRYYPSQTLCSSQLEQFVFPQIGLVLLSEPLLMLFPLLDCPSSPVPSWKLIHPSRLISNVTSSIKPGLSDRA